MSSVRCTVVLPIEVYIEFDCSKIMDDEYIEQKKEEAKQAAKKQIEIMNGECRFTQEELIIHESELPVLID